MHATASPPAHSPHTDPGPTGPAPQAPLEACPLCGGPLRPEQDWCLRCGAAARTRLAAAPNWKAPLAVVAVVVALSLGVLAAALVKLAGGSPAPLTSTRVVTAAAVPAPAPAVPAPAAAAPLTTPSTPAGHTTTPAPTGTPATHTPTVTAPPPPSGVGHTGARSGTLPRTSTPGTRSGSLSGIGGLIEQRLREQARRAGK